MPIRLFVGQKMVLFIEVSRDRYLYYFYRQSNGSTMRIFRTASISAFIAGNVEQDVRVPRWHSIGLSKSRRASKS